MKRVQFFKEPATSFHFALCLVISVHFVCRNKAQNEMNGTKEPASGVTLLPYQNLARFALPLYPPSFLSSAAPNRRRRQRLRSVLRCSRREGSGTDLKISLACGGTGFASLEFRPCRPPPSRDPLPNLPLPLMFDLQLAVSLSLFIFVPTI